MNSLVRKALEILGLDSDEAKDALSDLYEEAYQQGSDEGYDSGYDDGYYEAEQRFRADEEARSDE